MPWCIDEGVAVDHPQTHETSIRESRQHPEDALLLTVRELSLESDEVPVVGREVVLAQLDHCPRPPAGCGIFQADRLHRSEAQGVSPSLRHHLDRETPLEVANIATLEVLEGYAFGGEQGIDEMLVFVALER